MVIFINYFTILDLSLSPFILAILFIISIQWTGAITVVMAWLLEGKKFLYIISERWAKHVDFLLVCGHKSG